MAKKQNGTIEEEQEVVTTTSPAPASSTPEVATAEKTEVKTETPSGNAPEGMKAVSYTEKKFEQPEPLSSKTNPLNALYEQLLATRPDYNEKEAERLKKIQTQQRIFNSLNSVAEAIGATYGADIHVRGENKKLAQAVKDYEKLGNNYAAEKALWDKNLYNLEKLNSDNWTKWKYQKENQAFQKERDEDQFKRQKELAASKPYTDPIELEKLRQANRVALAKLKAKQAKDAAERKAKNQPAPKPFIDIPKTQGSNEFIGISEGVANEILLRAIDDPAIVDKEPMINLLKLDVQSGERVAGIKTIAVNHGWRYPDLIGGGGGSVADQSTDLISQDQVISAIDSLTTEAQKRGKTLEPRHIFSTMVNKLGMTVEQAEAITDQWSESQK